ncbi:MAG: tRNA (adenine-N1)-methyltransferase [Chloroflexi bacterium HGW-Chloroflexi-5]|nr:MAG: tRNA (adenine-N1)-methyltransferase [Chloroflexi bacterium HGW-Chloroflexi-5]
MEDLLSVEIEQAYTRAGDLIQLVGLSHKSFIFTLIDGGEFHTHRGVIKHDDLIGKPWGIQIFSHNGSPFFLLQPSLPDILKSTKRATQIMYPKEIGYILIQLGVKPGTRIIEAGTGSGSFTTALSYAIGDSGRIYSYEAKESNQKIAIRSLEKLGLTGNIEFKVRDIREGFDEIGVDTVFLDVANPYDYLKHVKTALKPGGFFASILPTMNQVTSLLTALRRNDFAFIDVCDISQRYYKTEPSRFRPTDRMIAHTGYLIFARSVTIDHDLADPKLLKEIGVLGIEDEKPTDMDELIIVDEATEE